MEFDWILSKERQRGERHTTRCKSCNEVQFKESHKENECAQCDEIPEVIDYDEIEEECMNAIRCKQQDSEVKD